MPGNNTRVRVKAAATMLLLALSFGHAAAQTAVPDTPAGKAARGWLDAFNRGDAAAYKDFVQKNWPSGVQYLDADRRFRQMTGGFDLKKVDPSSTPAKFVALVQERNSDQFAQLAVTVGEAEPHLITDVLLRGVPRPPEFALPHLSTADLTAALREKLQRDTASDRFSGAVLLAKDGKPVFAQAYGLADRERKTPNTLQTRFRIGSMNKMFTAVSTLQLAQAGKLRLDDPLGTYLPDYPNKDVASKVTIRQLLTHTGGTGDIFGPEFDAHRLELRTHQDYVNLFGKRAPKFEPGSRSEYSNYGFVLLGAVIEKVSGESYYDYVRKHVYDPAGMTATGSQPESEAVPARSVGYMDADGTLRPNTETLPYRGMSAGGGFSTVEDLLRFANALQQNKLLDAQHLRLLTVPELPIPGTDRRVALGFGSRIANGTRCYGHNGGAPGMNGDLEICANGRYVVAVLANRDPNAAQQISEFITNRLPEQ